MRLLGLVVAIALFFGIPLAWHYAVTTSVEQASRSDNSGAAAQPLAAVDPELGNASTLTASIVGQPINTQEAQDRAIEASVRNADAQRRSALAAAGQ